MNYNKNWDLIDLKGFSDFIRFLARALYKIIQGTMIRIRDLVDAVVSRRLVTLCVAPGAAPGAGDRR